MSSIAKKVIGAATLIQGENGATTYSFPLKGRDEWIEKMKSVGYVEIPEFSDVNHSNGYWCATCKYLIMKKNTPTGYWCTKFEFADRPEGCSSGWERKPS